MLPPQTDFIQFENQTLPSQIPISKTHSLSFSLPLPPITLANPNPRKPCLQFRVGMARAAETDGLRAVKREKASDGDAARLKAVKRERVSRNTASSERGGGEEEEEERVREVKRERVSRNAGDREEHRRKRRDGEESGVEGEDEQAGGGDVDPRELRSKYMAVKNQINDEKDDLNKVDSDKFHAIFREVQNLHQHVRKPREQVADAEALWGICSTLVSSVKSHSTGGITPNDFISGLVGIFGNQNRGLAENAPVSLDWKGVGSAVSEVFKTNTGCCTMLGPMDTELKKRKVTTRTRQVRSTHSVRPEELQSNGDEERTDTDKNMLTMFNILRKDKSVRLEQLILNRKSFAQTVENLFALSFLVKDGRARITVDEKGSHFISPKNAPAANLVSSKEVIYCHFILRMDFSDWKLMMDMVPDGEELMPHREPLDSVPSSQEQPSAPQVDTQDAYPTTPIRKLSRNRGIIIQENAVVEKISKNKIVILHKITPFR
uniref:Non-structural maintenance of chromosomes element 4 n=1 Tax=Kalanchoe fedtschenkoi TaxID=63787 RepID=A0A7N0RJ93_KALFE